MWCGKATVRSSNVLWRYGCVVFCEGMVGSRTGDVMCRDAEYCVGKVLFLDVQYWCGKVW